MRKLKLIFAAALLISPFAVDADLVHFELVPADTGDTLTWVLEPYPVAYPTFYLEFRDVPISVARDADMLSWVRFWFKLGNGLSILSNDGSFFTGYHGPVLFSGLVENEVNIPHFEPGVFDLYSDRTIPFPEQDIAATLTISIVPEPGTLALLGIGLVGMALARRRKAA